MTPHAAVVGRFAHYELRTTDVESARAFYAAILGESFWAHPEVVSISVLPEQARARGAPPHWLGHLETAALDEVASRFAAAGAMQLGPIREVDDGARVIAFRDPFGAPMALRTPSRGAPVASPVAWHLLNAADDAGAFEHYQSLFGWHAREGVDLPPGRHRLFAWTDTDAGAVGSVTNNVRLPEIHPQWLYFFPVEDFDGALGKVRALGKSTQTPVQGPGGRLVAACEDGQGSAFGLIETRARMIR